MTLNQVIWDIDPEIFRIGSFAVRYYSVLFAIAFLLGYTVMLRIFKIENVDKNLLQSLLIYVLVGTLIGARLGQTLFYEFDYYKDHLLEILFPFKFRNGSFEFTDFQGLASHGGALGILLAIYIYSKRKNQSSIWILDRVVIAVALGAFFIRLGNLFNSEIFGKPADLPWSFIFVRVDNISRHPSQLYEAISYLLIFFVLIISYKKARNKLKKGVLLGVFLVMVFTARFLLEYTKESQAAFERSLPLNMGQILSIPFIILGAYFILKKPQKRLNGTHALKDCGNSIHHNTR